MSHHLLSEPDTELLDPRWALSLGESEGELGLPIRRMVAHLLRSGESNLQRVVADVENGAREEARRQLHGLRGSYGSLGAMRLVAHSRALEEQLKAAASDADRPPLRQWQQTMQDTLEALRRWSVEHPPLLQSADQAPTLTQRRRWWRLLCEGDADVLDELVQSEAWLMAQFDETGGHCLQLARQRADLPELKRLLQAILAPAAEDNPTV
ncbi:Hpt domain-containing protein [Pseudomarimonas arenosa]|uniref:Hpt domain-containing protein n=1 Tax=Pseudomarimonas arenosa TaxID=2774145 RepID=A0AAW3ZNP5_9GAMM|nr:Hpt domain-containing protein [Pseudomarimonas arenosa]MBD8527793.1 Hpt domain-containing protein [Pseudomarimonas arenosa]